MKGSFLVLSILSIPLGFAVTQTAICQIPNGGFESWSGGEPPPWTTSNFPEAAPTAVNVTQTPVAREGSSALKGVITIAADIYGGSFEHFPGLYAGDDAGGFPIDRRPRALRGFWMYQPVGDYGSLGISIYLFKGEERTTVGYASAGRFVSVPDTAYQEFLAPINWLTNDVPDTFYISAGISSGEVGSVFYLDDLSFAYLEVLEPAADDVVISGETDTIRWNLATQSVDIWYSLDDGSSYVQIADDHPGNSRHYVWDVPDSLLSTRGRIRIVNTQDALDTALSGRFFLKPWHLTRIDASGDFELFQPAEDGWAYPNSDSSIWPESWWQQFDYVLGTDPNTGNPYPLRSEFVLATPGDFPDWPLFVEAFGVEQCYLGSSGPPAEYSERALAIWGSISEPWGGSCYGFAVSGYLSFLHRGAFSARYPGLGDYADLFGVPLSDISRAAINRYMVHQSGSIEEWADWDSITPNATLTRVKDILRQPDGDAAPLAFWEPAGSGGHAVAPYRLTRDSTNTRFNLRAYDSNNPAATNRGILFDSAANTWRDLTGLGWGTGSDRCMLGFPSGYHLQIPPLTLPPASAPRTGRGPMMQSTGLVVYNSPGAAITVTDAGGDSVGYADSTAFTTVPGGRPIIPLTGSRRPPIGYRLPPGGYAVRMGAAPDSLVRLGFVSDSTVYRYHRRDYRDGETDLLAFADGVGMSNPDTLPRSVTVGTIISVDGTERIFTVSGYLLAPGDSSFMRETGREGLRIDNPVGETAYDIEVRHATGAGSDRFFHASVPIGAGTSQHLLPDWGTVGTGPLKVLIDIGSDGSIDDSIFVSNDLTSVDDRIVDGVPAEFRLLQNFPNPFNPTTTIAFDLPVQAEVDLRVYNILGEEVATLAEGARRAGSYRVRFDGSGLPAGVYVYRLTAGGLTADGRMILLK